MNNRLTETLKHCPRFIFVILLIFALLTCVAYQYAAVRYRYSLDYGEAVIADMALGMAQGRNMYPVDLSKPPYAISNYPPVYIAVLAAGIKIFGAARAFVVGRLISVIATWAACIFIGLIVYKLSRDRFAALAAALMYAAFPFVYYWSPLLRVDMLGSALSLAALWILIAGPVSFKRMIISAAALVCSFYTRQSYVIAVPLAASVWLMVKNWRSAVRYILLVGGLSLFIFLILNTSTRGGFYFHVVTASVTTFLPDRLIFWVHRFWDIAGIFVLAGVFSLFLTRRSNALSLVNTPYLLGAAVMSLTIGKIGSNVNYFLELCAALSISIGFVIAWSNTQRGAYGIRMALMVVLSAGVVIMLQYTVHDYTGELHHREDITSELATLETLVVKSSGPVLMDEYACMLTLHGRPLYLHPFAMSQLADKGMWNQQPLLAGIQQKKFSYIILYDRWTDERWTPAMLAAISTSYVKVSTIAGNTVFRPL